MMQTMQTSSDVGHVPSTDMPRHGYGFFGIMIDN